MHGAARNGSVRLDALRTICQCGQLPREFQDSLVDLFRCSSPNMRGIGWIGSWGSTMMPKDHALQQKYDIPAASHIEITEIMLRRAAARTELWFCTTIVRVCLGVENGTRQFLPLKGPQIQRRRRRRARGEVCHAPLLFGSLLPTAVLQLPRKLGEDDVGRSYTGEAPTNKAHMQTVIVDRPLLQSRRTIRKINPS